MKFSLSRPQVQNKADENAVLIFPVCRTTPPGQVSTDPKQRFFLHPTGSMRRFMWDSSWQRGNAVKTVQMLDDPQLENMVLSLINSKLILDIQAVALPTNFALR